jgi:hypothetical protein
MESETLTQVRKRPSGMRKTMQKSDVVRNGEKMPLVERAHGAYGSGDGLEVYLPSAYVWIDLGRGTFYVGKYVK